LRRKTAGVLQGVGGFRAQEKGTKCKPVRGSLLESRGVGGWKAVGEQQKFREGREKREIAGKIFMDYPP